MIISKYLKLAVLLAFFLPFFPKGCEPKKAEEAPKTDTTAVKMDTASSKSFNANTTQDTIANDSKDTANTKPVLTKQKDEPNDDSFSAKISYRLPLLKPLLRPSDNFSGIGYALDVFYFFRMMGVAFALLLLVLGLVVKLKDYNSVFHLLNVLGVISLAFAQSSNPFTETRLWGYWVCLLLTVGMVIYDFAMMLFLKKKKKN